MKQKRGKYVSYDREHSLYAGHIDLHDWNGTGIKVCVILDDASRMMLASEEFTEINAENNMLIIDQLVDKLWCLCPLRELILDHGCEFGAHKIHDDGTWNSEFKDHLKKYGIKPILARVKHPQTNEKLERFFGEYVKHRSAFSSFDEFINWYNDSPCQRRDKTVQFYLRLLPSHISTHLILKSSGELSLASCDP